MKISISTAVFQPNDLWMALNIVDEFNVMLEISSAWDNPDFKAFIDNNSGLLAGVVRSFHEPYTVEHSSRRGSDAYVKTMDECKRTLEYAQKLNACYVVYHSSNCTLDSNTPYLMKKYAYENLMEINEIAAEHSVSILVENAGILSLNNALYTMDEYISLFDIIENGCLLDIGHMNCNGWDMENVMQSLKGRIKAYHVHNNYGFYDNHNRICDGTMYMPDFFDYYKAHTPDSDIILEYTANSILSIEDLLEDICFISECLNAKAPRFTYQIREADVLYNQQFERSKLYGDARVRM